MKGWIWLAVGSAVIWMGWNAQADIAPLKTAFHATGATPVGYSLNAWTRLSGKDSRLPLTTLLDKVSRSAKLTGTIHASRGTDFRKQSLQQTHAGITTRLIVERLGSGATYVVLDRVSTQKFYALNETEQLFHRLLGRYGQPHMAITLEGTVARWTSGKAQSAIIQHAFQAIEAKKVNAVQTAHYSSQAGFTPLISSHDSLQGHPINVQVAVAYNTYLHKTQVDVGSPLVTVTY